MSERCFSLSNEFSQITANAGLCEATFWILKLRNLLINYKNTD